ncbi:AP-3 complex subunit delta-1-like protein [Aphelenchoides avenae]|nr:AP-3 complex subunit delta-1-like protein [Aphelenchus avenae]
MALRKVRSNLDRLFDKNLTDLIRGIRNNKENEARYIAACIEEIKVELRQDSTFVKANAIEKLGYLQMLGYDISWASFNIIEVMASTKFCEKRIGYLVATQCFNDQTDVLMLTTNMLRKDLSSTNLYDVGVALSGLACFVTPDLARDLVNDVGNLLSSSRTYVRKKSVLLLFKIFVKYPESLRPMFARLKEKLEDPDSGVQSAAVNVICELARKNPKNYLSLAPVFFKLMTTSSNNWMLIKIIKLFGALVPLEARLGKKLLEPLTNLINSTSAMSLLYECINTVIAVLISISSEGPGDHTPSIQLCVQKLGVLIEDSDQNLKYLGLQAMARILQTHPKAVQAHKDIVMRCLDDKDESIRIRSLDLLYGMVSKRNIMEIVKKLMEHVDAAEGSYYRDELLQRIISICSYNNYQYITNFEWYISVLVELTKVEGSKHGVLIAEQIQDVTVRVQSIRHFSVSQMALLVENAHLLLSGNSTQRNNLCEVLTAAAWICGEYSQHVRDIPSVLEAMLRTKISIVPGTLLSVYVENIGKLYSTLLTQYEKEDDWDRVESLDNLLLSKLPEFQLTDHLEAQERACNLVELVKFIEQRHASREKMAEAVAELFDGELNPVSSKAQRRVPVPEGLDLDAWINEPEPETEPESESEPEQPHFPTMPAQTASRSLYDEDEEEPPTKAEKAKKKKRDSAELSLDLEESKRRRQFEQENNPYYVKADKKVVKEKTPTGRAPHRTPHKGSVDRSESATASELQSPLEIPGVIGLDRYLKQQESTLSWKTAKSELNAKKKTKGKRKGGKRGKGTTLSVLSSSDDEEPGVVHKVNRDDGEMPEGALSSGEEAAENGVSNEFKALDINLDEPLRDDEKLFAPKAYATPADDYNSAHRLPSTPRATTTQPSPSNDLKPAKAARRNGADGKPKKTKKKEKEAKSTDKPARVDSTKKKKRRKSEKSVESAAQEGYTTISSSANLEADHKAAVVQDILTFSDNGSTNGVLATSGQSSSYMPLCEDDLLKMRYAIKVTASDAHKVSVGVVLHNKSAQTVRRIELNVLETLNARLDRSNTSSSDAAVLLPFELPSNVKNEHNLHFSFKEVNVTQKIRGSVTYFVEENDGNKREAKMDYVLHFPAIRFLKFATIGSTSYELMLSGDELPCSSAAKCASTQPLQAIVDALLVEIVADAASLYANSADGEPVCVLVKKQGDNVSISSKCTDQKLAYAVAQDISDLIATCPSPDI